MSIDLVRATGQKPGGEAAMRRRPNWACSAIFGLMALAMSWAGAGAATAQTEAPWYNAWFSPSTITAGGTTQLGMNIFNNNSAVAMTGLAIQGAQLPVGLTGSNPTSTCGGTASYNGATRTLSLSGASIAADSMCNLSLTVTAATTGSYSYTGGGISAVAGGVTYSRGGTTTSTPLQVLGPPVATSFSYGSIVGYNGGSNPTTILDLSLATTGAPTSYAVGSATTAQGGSVSVNSAGQATYVPPVGFRGGTDSFTWIAGNTYGTSASATVSITIGNPTLTTWLTGSGTRGTALSGVQINVSDGAAPYSCGTSVTSGALPAGVSINSNCTLSGTPAASGTFNFTVNVTDSSTGAGPYTATSGALTLAVAAPSVSLSPASGALPGATAGASYSQTLTASGTTAPYSYALTAGALPSGLTLVGGTLSGTPTAVGAFNFTVTATDSSTAGSGGPYTVANAYALTVAPPVIALSSSLPAGTVGTAYANTVTASGGTGAYSYAVTGGALPTGVTLAANGALSGTPTAGGAFTFTITATDTTTGPSAPYTGSQAYSVAIGAPVITLSPGVLTGATVGVAYSATVTASGGTAGYGYAVTAGALPPGLTLSSTGSITGTPTAGGTFNFTLTASDSSTGTGAPFTGSQAYALTVTPATVVVAPTPLPNGAAGTAYSQTVTASGGTGPYAFAVTAGALPPGWTLSSAGGLSGTATATGSFTFTLTATDSSTGAGAPYTGSRNYTVLVGSPNFTLTPPTLSGTVGQAYSGAFLAGGGTAPYTYSRMAGTLPPGMTLAADGVLSGTPTASGTFNFAVVARDTTAGPGAPFGVVSNYNFTVSAPTLALAPATLPNGSVGAAYSTTVTASGGTAPYSYQHTAGALPPGLTLDTASGTVSGTPTATGAFNFTLTAGDSSTGAGAPFTVARAYTVVIGAGAQTITFDPLPDVQLSALPLSLSATADSGLSVSFFSDTPAVCSVSGVTLTLLQTGICTVRAEQAGDATYAAAPSVSRSFNVTANPPVAADLSGVNVPFESEGTTIDLSASLSGGAHTALSVAVAPAHGTVTIAAEIATYTPAAGYFGADSFAWTATGPGGTSAPATVSLTVATPLPPVVDEPAPVVVEPTDGSGSTSVDLSAVSSGVVTGFRVEDAPSGGQASLLPPSGGSTAWRLVYTPALNFMGEDHLTVVAEGPGGASAPAQFVFRVRGRALDLEGVSTDGEPLTFEPTAGLTGGPFQGLAIIRQPEIGSAEVVGLTIVYTPGGAAAPTRLRAASVSPSAVGQTSIEYVVVLGFGQSAPGVIAIDAVQTTPVLAPLTATTLAGRPVTVSLTDTATGGPFTAATVVNVSDDAGAAIINAGGALGARTYELTFTSKGNFTGVGVVTYTLSNAGGPTQGVLLVTVDARPDPSQDPEVRGLMSAQVDSARRFTRAQTDNFHRRLEQVRRGGSGGASNGLSLNLGHNGLTDDPREALRAQLGQRRDGPSPFGGDEDSAALLGRWSDSHTSLAARSGVAPAVDLAPVTVGQGALGVWTSGSVDWGRRDAKGQRDYRFTTSGLSAGVDMAVSDSVVVGLGVGYGHDRSKVGDNGTLSEADSYVGAVYGNWRASEGLVVDGVLGYGALEYDSRRWSLDEDGFLLGQRSGSLLFGSASVALERSWGPLIWAPYARISFGSIALNGFTETGSEVFALNYSSLGTDTLASTLGASFDWSLLRRDGVLSPNLRFEWSHEFEGADAQIVSYADWLASPDYAVDLERWARDSVSMAVGLHWRGLSGWSYGADYQSQIGSGLASHGLRLRLLRVF